MHKKFKIVYNEFIETIPDADVTFDEFKAILENPAYEEENMNENDKIVKALELNGKSNMLYFRDSVSGKVCAKNKEDEFKLNKALHENN